MNGEVAGVTIVRIGSTQKYAQGWESAFAKGKQSPAKSAPQAAAKKSAKPKSAKKKAAGKKR